MPAGRADPEQKKRGFFGGGGEKKMKKEGEKNRNEGAQNVINHKYR